MFDVRTRSIDVPAGTLSGGNQQKLILARELETDPKLLLAAQPTRGLDVGAIEFVWSQILEQKAEGRGVLLISAELDEIYASPTVSSRCTRAASPVSSRRTLRSTRSVAACSAAGTVADGGSRWRPWPRPTDRAAARRERPGGSSRCSCRGALLLALVISLVIGAVIIVLYGESPIDVYGAILAYAFRDGTSFGQVLDDRDAADLLRARGRRVLQGRAVQHRRRGPVPGRHGDGHLGGARFDFLPGPCWCSRCSSSACSAGWAFAGIAGVLKVKTGPTRSSRRSC